MPLLMLGAACGSSSRPAPPPLVIGATGGTASDGAGASVVVPPGALSGDITIRVAKDSTGAPALPAGLVAAGDTYVITPHGGNFAQPVQVRIPAPSQTLQANQELRLAKAQPGGEWLVLDDSGLRDGALTAQVNSFSFFVAVTMTYLLPIAQLEPFGLTAAELSCGDKSCSNALGTVNATYSVASNNGQLPANCGNGQLQIQEDDASQYFVYGRTGAVVPLGGGSVTRTLEPRREHFFMSGLKCSGFARAFGSRTVSWNMVPDYPSLKVMRSPATVEVVEGRSAAVEVVLAGGTRYDGFLGPRVEDRAVIDWQRSDDGGASWRPVARSYQNEANFDPLGDGVAWRYWSVRHAFVATAADDGALLRVNACYTPPNVPAPPCVVGPSTRLNVVQQSALPGILEAPRALLVRVGQTANFSVVAGGIPAPTLQWQSREANSTGDWSDLAGATGASYTTAPLTLGDNGRQYRVVATNAVGTAASAPATVSVSDLDVAPTITTQPASLGVTAGSDAAFAIAARGTEALSYQWRRDGAAIAGANGPVLRLGAVSAGQAGGYSVVVSNAAGSATSAVATLTVSPGLPAPLPPAIVTQPASVVVGSGNTATFAVGASGDGLRFQWRKDGVDLAGATAAALTLLAVAPADAGVYSVVVSNGVGSVTSGNASLEVAAPPAPTPPSIATQPSTLVVMPGGAATLAVAANGSGPLAYQWSHDGSRVGSVTGPVLQIAAAGVDDEGSYVVTVSNAAGSVTSAAAQIIIVGAPVLTAQPASASVTEGSSATFTVAATGTGLRYQWLRNGAAIDSAIRASYDTPATVLSDSGAVFSVLVYNSAGLAMSQGAVLTVTPAAVTRTWQTAGLIETANLGAAQDPQIAANAQGVAFAVWYQSNGVSIDIYANRYTPAAGWGTPELIETDNAGVAQLPQVAVDAGGNALAVWQQQDIFGVDNIWANRFTAGAGWGAAALIEAGPGGAGNAQIAMDGAGNAIAVWWQHEGGNISTVANRYVVGAGWGTAAAIEADSSGDVSAPQIAVNANGDATAVWAWGRAIAGGFEFNVWSNRYTAGTGWGTAVPIDDVNPSTANLAPHVAVDVAGNAIAVWHRPDGSWDSIWSNRYVAGAGWGIPALVETDNTNSARDARVAVDAGGNALAVWTQNDGIRQNIMANRYSAGAGWGTAELIETDNAGPAFEPRVAIDGAGNATAVWSQRNAAAFTDDIWTNRYSAGAGWGTALIIDGNSSRARAPQVAVDGNGNALTVWQQADGTTESIWANRYQ